MAFSRAWVPGSLGGKDGLSYMLGVDMTVLRRASSGCFFAALALLSGGCDKEGDQGAAAQSNGTTSLVGVTSASAVAESTSSLSSSVGDTSHSQPAQVSSTGVTTGATPTLSCIPGSQRKCSRDVGVVVSDFPTGQPLGNCRFGHQFCGVNGEWEPCEGVVLPQLKDRCEMPGDDANCDGIANEECECVVASSAPRLCGKAQGQCRQGYQRCEAGRWGDCIGEIGPEPERCDGLGLDEDCNGRADRTDPACACIDGQDWRSCVIPEGKGDCGLGVQACVNGAFQACAPRFEASRESCLDPRMDIHGPATGDEDCDGLVDETNGTEDPLHCRLYIMDRDGDGWGAIGISAREYEQRIEKGEVIEQEATFGCFCRLPIEYEKMERAKDASRVNKDCGDCWVWVDEDIQFDAPLVNPGQTKFFEKPSECLQELGWKGGAFDYNCSGAEEPRYVGQHQGDCLTGPAGNCYWEENTSGHWIEAITPPCGAIEGIPQCADHNPVEMPNGCRKWVEGWADSDVQECR